MAASPDGLPPLREVIRAHGLDARKSLGQNFLLDLNLTRKIARAAGPLDQHTMIEVGPGPGGLTRALLMEGARHVIAIERDTRCIAALREIEAAYPGRLTLIEADAQGFDFSPLLAGARGKIVANLPYNIGTALLVDWLTSAEWPPFFDSLTLMFQREVAERIIATPATPRAYGRLGVLAGWRMQPKILFDVPASAFTPAPKVTSSVVQLLPRANPAPVAIAALEAVTRAAFGQRRKMLRQSLKPLGDAPALLAAGGLDGSERPETLGIEQFIAMAKALRL